MLLVVLGHTISGSTSMFEETILYQIIWTLQMPLFFIISGFVTRYSKPIDSGRSFWTYLKKRSLAYLFPWAVWTFLIRGFVFHQYSFFNVKYLLWHMDSGYWFLFTIWTISLINLCADYLSNRLTCKPFANTSSHLLFFAIGIAILGGVGYFVGFSFLCIKLSLYYAPFYLLGFLYGRLIESISSLKDSRIITNVVITISLFVWIALVARYDFYSEAGVSMTVLRFFTSLMGCVAATGILTSVYKNGGGNLFKWAGIHSLEIYLTHYLFLCLFSMGTQPLLFSLDGLVMTSVNYAITMIMVKMVISLSQRNSALNFLLYAKRVHGPECVIG